MSNSSIWPIDRTLSGATTPGQSGPGSDDNEWVIYIPQSSNIKQFLIFKLFASFSETIHKLDFTIWRLMVIYKSIFSSLNQNILFNNLPFGIKQINKIFGIVTKIFIDQLPQVKCVVAKKCRNHIKKQNKNILEYYETFMFFIQYVYKFPNFSWLFRKPTAIK